MRRYGYGVVTKKVEGKDLYIGPYREKTHDSEGLSTLKTACHGHQEDKNHKSCPRVTWSSSQHSDGLAVDASIRE